MSVLNTDKDRYEMMKIMGNVAKTDTYELKRNEIKIFIYVKSPILFRLEWRASDSVHDSKCTSYVGNCNVTS